jgi:methylthioribose-1-phosphate isomerase
VNPVAWEGEAVRILDQRKLPVEEAYLECRDVESVADAIRSLAVRGAPAIGIAAGFGVALAAVRAPARSRGELLRELRRAGRMLIAARPTAVNLPWAVGRVVEAASAASDVDAAREAAVAEALAVAGREDEACLLMAELGQALVPEKANVLTHCNTGRLACAAGFGTAQGVMYAAHRAGKRVHVWVDETRPVLQGSRLTAWELQRLGVPMTLVADSAAGLLMAGGRVDLVIVGADRIAANGDVANKIGTYQLAVLAAHHGVPLYVTAPTSTIDPATPTGRDILIEERAPEEVTAPGGVPFAPAGTPALNPAFDVTPAALVTAIITERGVVRPPYRSGLRRILGHRGRRGE